MSKTAKSSTSARKSRHNYDEDDILSDELSVSSSEEDVATRKSRKLQPTDAADYEGGGMYDRGGRRGRRSGRRSGSRRKRSRSRRRRR